MTRHTIVNPKNAMSISIESLTEEAKNEVYAIVESMPKLPFSNKTVEEDLDDIERKYFEYNPMAMCNIGTLSKTVIGHEDVPKEVLVPLRCLNSVRRTLGYLSFEEMLGEQYVQYMRLLNKDNELPQIHYISFLFPAAMSE